MKFTKMSLVAALLIGSSAFAIDNVKVSGDAKVFYNTNDAQTLGYRGVHNSLNNKTDGSLFSKDNSAADAALDLAVSADLVKNSVVAISAGASYTVLSTLGLENNLVSNVWGGAHGATANTGASYAGSGISAAGFNGVKVENANWMKEAWMAATLGKTTAKIGRMELDTPLVFSEKWSIEENTFEAAVVINQDIPDTTLVGAYVGNGNGNETMGQDINGTVVGNGLAVGAVVNQGGQFTTFGQDGAYAVGAINNSFKPITVQAWYYDVTRVAEAYWLQADLNAADLGVKGLTAGVQYTSVKPSNGTYTKSASVYALMLGYEVKDMATIKVAYSSENKDSATDGAGGNVATDTGASKLYTEAWWNYGYVTDDNTDAYNISIAGNAAGVELAAYYTQAKRKAYTKHDTTTVSENKMTEFALTAGKSFGPLDTTLAYVYTKADDQNVKTTGAKGSAYNTVQAYLTLNF